MALIHLIAAASIPCPAPNITVTNLQWYNSSKLGVASRSDWIYLEIKDDPAAEWGYTNGNMNKPYQLPPYPTLQDYHCNASSTRGLFPYSINNQDPKAPLGTVAAHSFKCSVDGQPVQFQGNSHKSQAWGRLGMSKFFMCNAKNGRGVMTETSVDAELKSNMFKLNCRQNKAGHTMCASTRGQTIELKLHSFSCFAGSQLHGDRLVPGCGTSAP